MAKEWILNSAMNRYQLNFTRNVGRVSETIRACQPKNLSEWETYYFANVRSKEHLEELGRKLYVKVSEVIAAEVAAVTEEECVQYMFDVVIRRTYDGYDTEIKTIYGQVESALAQKVEPAPDDWDRNYTVDFFIKVGESFIGLQIKPVSDVSSIPQIYQERSQQLEAHERFTRKFGGKVFYVFSAKEGGRKQIANPEVIEEIRQEIARLSQ
jgi:hypothetical protein